MPQLNNLWYHKLINYFFPQNCRKRLADAIVENQKASIALFRLVNTHKADVVAALKNDRRTEMRT